MTKRRVFLGLPSYDVHEIEMARACLSTALKEGEPERFAVTVQPRKGCSLLASAFNGCWTSCLNYTDPPFEYFAMVHGDVQPQWIRKRQGPDGKEFEDDTGWLDVLIDEMEKYQLDLIHAPVAIKDSRGVTSTAIGRIDEDWSPVRKVTTEELQKLPDTFTVADCIQRLSWVGTLYEGLPTSKLCMLHNTGCWVAKLGPWARKFPGFTIRDRLFILDDNNTMHFSNAYSRDSKAYYMNTEMVEVLPDIKGIIGAHVFSEDWNMGLWMARMGLKVGACRKVTTIHHGKAQYRTAHAWGTQSKDESFYLQPKNWK